MPAAPPPADARLGSVTPGPSVEQARRRLALLLRLALAHLESGRPTPDMERLVQGAAQGLGLPGLLVVATGRSVMLQVTGPDGPDGTVLERTGIAATLHVVDCERMRRLERLSTALAEGDLGEGDGSAALTEAVGPTWPWWYGPLGMTVLSMCVVMQVGVGLLAVPLTAVVQLVISLMGVLAGRLHVPQIFAVALLALAGGIVALLAASVHLAPWPVVAAAVAVPWMLLVPLPVLVNTVVDAVSGQELTALSRAAAFTLTVGGLVLGAGALFAVARGADVTQTPLTLPTFAIPLGLLFAVLGALANAIANGGGRPLLLPAAVMGLFTAICNQSLLHLAHLQPFWASTLSAVLLGIAAGLWCTRLAYPAATLALMGITGALLPGLTVYRGVLAEMMGRPGAAAYGEAALVAIGLGVGVTAGFQLVHVVLRTTGRDRVRAVPA